MWTQVDLLVSAGSNQNQWDQQNQICSEDHPADGVWKHLAGLGHQDLVLCWELTDFRVNRRLQFTDLPSSMLGVNVCITAPAARPAGTSSRL